MNDTTNGRVSWATRNPVASWTITVCLAVAIIATLGLSRNDKSGGQTSPESTGVLVIAPAALEFGDRQEGQPFSWDLPITNNSKKTIEVSKVDTSCNCAGVEPKTLTFGPGETRNLRLTLDLHAKQNESVDKTSHEIFVIAHVAGQDGRPHTWKLRGTSRRILNVAPSPVTLEKSFKRECPSKQRRSWLAPGCRFEA